MVKRGKNYFQEQNKVDSGSCFTDGMYLWQLYIKQVYRGGSGGGKAGSGILDAGHGEVIRENRAE